MPNENTVHIFQYRAGKGQIPDGSCQVSDAAFTNYEKARELGLRVTAEMLSTGEVSLCLEEPRLGDFAISICTNGPGEKSPPALLEKMLLKFNEDDFKQWKKEVS